MEPQSRRWSERHDQPRIPTMMRSSTALRRIAGIGVLAAAAFSRSADAQTDKSLTQQIFETMIQVPGYNPAYRAAHAKGVVCQGTFTPSKDAASLSKAAHFQGGSIPVTVRFSDASPDPL